MRSSLARLRPNDLEALRREGVVEGSIAWALKDRDMAGAVAWARRYVATATALAGRFPDQEIVTESLSDAHADVANFLSTAAAISIKPWRSTNWPPPLASVSPPRIPTTWSGFET